MSIGMETETMENLTTCAGCGRQCVPHRTWRHLTEAERDQHRAEGLTVKLTRDKCQTCYYRDVRGEPTRAAPVDMALIVEEWNWLADPNVSDRLNAENLAPRLGLTVNTLEKAVQRARAAGSITASSVAA